MCVGVGKKKGRRLCVYLYHFDRVHWVPQEYTKHNTQKKRSKRNFQAGWPHKRVRSCQQPQQAVTNYLYIAHRHKSPLSLSRGTNAAV